MEKNLTTGSVFKAILTFALPYLLSYFLQTLYGMADLYITGRFCGVDSITAVAALTPVTENKFTTVVLSRENVNEWLSVRNIPTVHPIFADQLNTYDVVTAQYVVFSKEGFDAFLAAKAEPAAKEA